MSKTTLRLLSGAILLCTVSVGVWSMYGTPKTAEAASLIPPDDATPEFIATRGCIEGVAHPSGADLTRAAIFAACDSMVDLAEDPVSARMFRSRRLVEEGFSEAHDAQALSDLNYVIAADPERAGAHSRRGHLRAELGDLEGGLEDLNTAIQLRGEEPRSVDYERRAIVLAAIGHRDADENFVLDALEDLKILRDVNPFSKTPDRLEAWAKDFLRALHRNEGRPVRGG